jgi:tRNA-uridine 2-sulfurtransferase
MNKVLLAMSGGTDSSVSALLLKHQGYKIEGITFKMWQPILKSCDDKEQGCCNTETLLEARELARKLGFPHHITDVTPAFEKHVIQNFVKEYLRGHTPNPCVVCNTHIKWGVLMDEMIKQGHSFFATGHYARVKKKNNRYVLQRGADLKKDQSYFLWTLSQQQLSHTIFPLGDLSKDKVREIARQYGFEHIAEKRESQEICFIPDNDYRRFLRDQVTDIDTKPGEGWFVDKNGKKLGKHKGYPFYTIGQRRGLNIALGYPAYVISIDAENNTIVVGEYSDLHKHELNIKNCNWIKYQQPPKNILFDIKIRYNTPPVSGRITTCNKNTCHITLENPLHAITPGQSAVLYDGDDVVGGGIICK